jgi:hypothetical protein
MLTEKAIAKKPDLSFLVAFQVISIFYEVLQGLLVCYRVFKSEKSGQTSVGKDRPDSTAVVD